jgi:hypothetical protein
MNQSELDEWYDRLSGDYNDIISLMFDAEKKYAETQSPEDLDTLKKLYTVASGILSTQTIIARFYTDKTFSNNVINCINAKSIQLNSAAEKLRVSKGSY